MSFNAQYYLWKLYSYMVPTVRENDKKKQKISHIDAQYFNTFIITRAQTDVDQV